LISLVFYKWSFDGFETGQQGVADEKNDREEKKVLVANDQ